jgi:hypothetical protein
MRCHEFMKKNIKNYMEKDCCILQYFQEKNYKDNFRKKHKKTKEKKTM